MANSLAYNCPGTCGRSYVIERGEQRSLRCTYCGTSFDIDARRGDIPRISHARRTEVWEYQCPGIKCDRTYNVERGRRHERLKCSYCGTWYSVDGSSRKYAPTVVDISIYSDGRTATGKRERFYTLNGRDSRLEFFIFSAFLLAMMFAVGWMSSAGQNPAFFVFLAAVAWIGYLASLWRRAHDIGWSGWWALLGLIPLIGLLQMIVFCCTPGNAGANKYGPSPLRKAPPY